ncbi:MAG: IS3 family transposase [Gilliamella sp.]|nr:IS3 family transposase [Gilliamella sp.]
MKNLNVYISIIKIEYIDCYNNERIKYGLKEYRNQALTN